MRFLQKLVVVSVLFCSITTSVLLLWPISAPASANEQVVNQGGASTIKTVEAPAPEKIMLNDLGKQGSSVATIYAPRDVVDMTRLVLEASRDQSARVSQFIEHATTVIVVFFSVLGAIGAVFGLHKLHDIEAKAKERIVKFEEDLQKSKQAADTLAKEYELNFDNAIQSVRDESSDNVELLLAKMEIKMANDTDIRTLRNIANRIKPVLERNLISKKARLRGLADHAWTLKRLGSYEDAYKDGKEAAQIAETEEPGLHYFLAFNTACYASLLNRKSEAVEWLTTSISKNPSYKDSAKVERDFENLKDFPEFIALMQ